MIDISNRSCWKYPLFASLYFIQGILSAISYTILPIYLVDIGYSLAISSIIIGIAMLPWTLKFFWGGFVDYFKKYGRKRFIIIGGFLSFITLIVIGFVDANASIIMFTILYFICVLGIVILDVAADGWAIELSYKDEHGKITGSMFGGQYIGRAFGAIFLGFLAFTYGYNYVFLMAGIFILVVTFFPLIFEESKIDLKKIVKIRKTLINEFKKKNIQIISLLAFLSIIGSGIITVLIPWYLEDIFNFNISEIGLIIAGFLILSAIGSLSGGALADKFGRKKIIYIFTSCTIISIITLGLSPSWILFIIIYAFVVYFQSGYYSVVVAILMDVTNPQLAATQFSIFASIVNFGLILGNSMSGSLITIFGFNRAILYGAWFMGPLLIVLYFVKIEKQKIPN